MSSWPYGGGFLANYVIFERAAVTTNGIDFCYPQRIVVGRHYWAKSPETIMRLNRFAIELEK